jgi:hypothetical protein
MTFWKVSLISLNLNRTRLKRKQPLFVINVVKYRHSSDSFNWKNPLLASIFAKYFEPFRASRVSFTLGRTYHSLTMALFNSLKSQQTLKPPDALGTTTSGEASVV